MMRQIQGGRVPQRVEKGARKIDVGWVEHGGAQATAWWCGLGWRLARRPQGGRCWGGSGIEARLAEPLEGTGRRAGGRRAVVPEGQIAESRPRQAGCADDPPPRGWLACAACIAFIAFISGRAPGPGKLPRWRPESRPSASRLFHAHLNSIVRSNDRPPSYTDLGTAARLTPALARAAFTTAAKR